MTQLIQKITTSKLMVLALLTCLLACGAPETPVAVGTDTPKSQAEKLAAVPIAVEPIKIGEATSLYATTATLEAESKAEVLARSNGVVQKIFKEEGDRVEEGELLVLLDDADQKLNLKMALLKADNLEKEFQRQKKVYEDGILSAQDFETLEGKLAEARANVEQSELMLSYTKIKAPFSGDLVRRMVDLGAHLQPNTPVFEIMDVTPLLARIHIPAVRMGHVQLGQSVSLRLESSNVSLEGKVHLISPIVDPNTGTVKITAEIPVYPAGTRPGDFAQAEVVTERRGGAMLVPSVAVFEDKGQQVLFTANAGKAIRKVVTLGFVERGVTEIRSGLDGSELIVVKGQRNLRDDMPIEILEGPGIEASTAQTNTADQPTGEAAP